MSALAGIGYRARYRDALLAADGPRPGVLEIMPDHFLGHPALERTLDQLAERYTLVFHDVGLSIGTADTLPRNRLREIARLVRRVRPLLFGEHLALTRSPSGIDLGHLAPLWWTQEQLALVVEQVAAIQDVLGVPIVIENITSPFSIPNAELAEPEAFTQLVERTGCGMLLDVTNLLYNARNQGVDPAPLLARYPLAAVRQIHIAGGVARGREWIDTHSEPIEDSAFALLGSVARARPALTAIVVERDANLPPLEDLVAEARRAVASFETEEEKPC